MRRIHLASVFMVVSFLFAGCASTGIHEGVQPYQFDNFGADHSVVTKPKLKVAVLPFRNATGVGGAGVKVAESFLVQLLKVGRYEVVERSRLEQILREQDFAQSQYVDPESAVKVGRIAGVDAVLIGSVTDYRDIWERERPPEVGTSLRLISVETGSILWAASEHFRGDDVSVQLLVKRQDRWKVATDIDFLTTVLCRSLASSMAL